MEEEKVECDLQEEVEEAGIVQMREVYTHTRW